LDIVQRRRVSSPVADDHVAAHVDRIGEPGLRSGA
jgi:hypothetical protein